MKILMIGGPKFLGRHLITAALDAGHEITLFNRGNYSANLGADLPGVKTIRGDRYRDLDKLAGRKWDAVVDTCGYLPQNVKTLAEALARSVDRYVFISSISAYADFSKTDFDESSPPAVLTDDQEKRAEAIDLSGEITAYKLGDLYGPLKVRCEQAVENAMPGRAIIARPGLIVGVFDTTDRFTYWVLRVADGGEVLAPGDPNRFVQLIDARDLAEWVIKAVEDQAAGIFNVNGKPFDLTMGDMLAEIKNVSGSNASFTWASEEFLTAENIKPWSEMPLYMPPSNESLQGFLTVNVDKAVQKGLVFRPLSETITDVINWRKTMPETQLKAGITREAEAKLLEKLRLRV